jgi:hypothetical protein
MASEKKFLYPTVYPKDFSETRQWFIKYYEEDFISGGLKPKKYYGLLNRTPDINKRNQLAAQYLQ